MAGPIVLALAPGTTPTADEPWVLPDLLDYARAEPHVDLMSVCRVASHILYLLSGRRYGVRTETIRPHAGDRAIGWDRYFQAMNAGYSLGLPPLTMFDDCGNAARSITLRDPVQAIQSVKLNGQVLNSTEYAVFDRRTLVRTADANGARSWPLTQLLDRPDTEAGTFSVTYQWGQAVPEGGQLAAQSFAKELAKYINQDGSALPDRTVTVTRQGITQTMLDPSQFLREARTGLYLVDIWLGSVNPNGLRRRPSISSPETIAKVRPS